MSIRDPAREFKEKPEEVEIEPLFVYEVADRTAIPDQPYFDVFQRYHEKADFAKFKNLQPCNLKPYGSQEQEHLIIFNRKNQPKIVYPVVGSGNEAATIQKVQSKQFSTKKETSAGGDLKKPLVHRTSSTKIASKSYSTVARSTKQRLARNLNNSMRTNQKQKTFEVYEEFLQKSFYSTPKDDSKRNYNTLNNSSKCGQYVKVKLGELQEQCRKEKKCKPKKIKFGQLPKLKASDCPCIDDLPLKEGTGLNRLKKRFEIKEKERVDCTQIDECKQNKRADDGYQIKKKQLPTIEVMDCPCEEREMTDFVIKRLPKKKVVELPKRICVVEDPCADTPRADDNMKIKSKQLPKFKAKQCAQVCPKPIVDVPLYR